MNADAVAWVLTTGEAGMRSQAMGLAEAVGLPIVEKRIVLRRPWSWLPGGLLPLPLAALGPEGDRLAAPWPALVVGCGRRSIGPSLLIKRLSEGACLAAYVQNPEFARRKFDLVAAMPHDGVSGRNVVVTQTAMHLVTPQRLAAAREGWRQRFAPGAEAAIGVLVGGDNGSYRLTAEVAERLARILRDAHSALGVRALITTSRRTSAATKHILATALGSEPWADLWTGEGPNPYFGILGLSDRLIITAESISMISEALATGRPVHVLPLEGKGRRHDAFLRRIVEERLVSRIEGDALDWGFAGPGPVNATPAVAHRIREMLTRQGVKLAGEAGISG